ncbi:SNF2-related protein [Enterobacter asburiae]
MPGQKWFQFPIRKQGDRLAAGTLKQLIKPFVLRRTKTQVLDELPPTHRHPLYHPHERRRAALVRGAAVAGGGTTGEG